MMQTCREIMHRVVEMADTPRPQSPASGQAGNGGDAAGSNPAPVPNKADDGGAWWCNTHNREAKGRDADGNRCCEMALSGEAKACAVVRAPGASFAHG